jgi:LmbE family N-acetylglucosaminyl deacetylase
LINNKTYDVVCFGAHPDDVEFGMGGTVLKLVKKGKKVLLVVFTRGEKGTYGTPLEREQELINACQLIGSDYHIMPWIDCEFENSYENKLLITKIIRQTKPTICFAPYHTHYHDHHNGAAHPDHLRCGLMVKDALRFARFKNILPEIEHHDVKQLFYYMVPRELKPSFVIDVNDEKEKLTELMKCHASQMNIKKGDKNALSLLTTYREITGLYSYTGFSEAFYCEEILNVDVDHLFLV